MRYPNRKETNFKDKKIFPNFQISIRNIGRFHNNLHFMNIYFDPPLTNYNI